MIRLALAVAALFAALPAFASDDQEAVYTLTLDRQYTGVGRNADSSVTVYPVQMTAASCAKAAKSHSMIMSGPNYRIVGICFNTVTGDFFSERSR